MQDDQARPRRCGTIELALAGVKVKSSADEVAVQNKDGLTFIETPEQVAEMVATGEWVIVPMSRG